MKKKIKIFFLFLVIFSLLIFFQALFAAQPQPCDPCDVDVPDCEPIGSTDCTDGNLTTQCLMCWGDPNPGDGKKQGQCQVFNEVKQTWELRFCNPIRPGSLEELIKEITEFIAILAFPVTSLMIIIAGVLFLTSGGKPERISQAKKLLLYSAIGAGIIILAKAIASIIKGVLGG